MSRELREVVRGDPIRQLKCQALYKVTVFVFPFRSPRQDKYSTKSTTYKIYFNLSTLSSVDWDEGPVTAEQQLGPALPTQFGRGRIRSCPSSKLQVWPVDNRMTAF
jgi:hypothetical protein